MTRATARYQILLVDDERLVRTALAARLGQAGYDVREARTGAEALRLFGERRPDVVLLDVMMPGIDGFAVCAEMRRLDRETPIVFLSACDAERDQIRGLSLGADDYVSKAASEALLVARVRKALERADRFSRLDAPPSMTKTEADIFRLLESECGRFFTFREIGAAVVGEGYMVDESLIRVHISHMRRKLPKGFALTARRRVGYALVPA